MEPTASALGRQLMKDYRLELAADYGLRKVYPVSVVIVDCWDSRCGKTLRERERGSLPCE